MNRRVAINLTFFAGVFAVMIVWSVNNIVTIEALERPYSIAAEFEQTSGVQDRAEVAYLGVSYGYVSGVERIDGGVRVSMKIDRGKRIPAGATAHIFRKSAIGEPFVDFFPPEGYEGEGPFLQADDVVPASRTTTPLEFSELLRSASRLVSGIDPERLQVLLHELALALHGHVDDLRLLTRSGDQLAATFAERTDLIDRFAESNTALTAVMARARTDLGQAVTDLRDISASLRRASGNTQVLLDRGTTLVRQTADLVEATRPVLDCILTDLTTVIDTASTPARLDGLRRYLHVAPVAFAGVWDSRDMEPDGVWVRVGTITNPQNPSEQYVPPKPVPEAPPVVPCDAGSSEASASSSSGDQGPGTAAPNGGRRMPPLQTGGLALAVAIATAAMVMRSVEPRQA